MTTQETISREDIERIREVALAVREQLPFDPGQLIALCDLALKGLEAQPTIRRMPRQPISYSEPEGAAPEDRGEKPLVICPTCKQGYASCDHTHSDSELLRVCFQCGGTGCTACNNHGYTACDGKPLPADEPEDRGWRLPCPACGVAYMERHKDDCSFARGFRGTLFSPKPLPADEEEVMGTKTEFHDGRFKAEPEGAAPEDRGEPPRTMLCPYCGYTRQTKSVGAIYCGPHHSCHGNNVYPAVQMVEQLRRPLPSNTGDEVDGVVEQLTKGRSVNEWVSEELAHEAAALIQRLTTENERLRKALTQIAMRDSFLGELLEPRSAQEARAALSGGK